MTSADYATVKLEHISCPRCHNETSREILSGEDFLYEVPGEFHVAECAACGLWFQNPRPAPASLSVLYPGDYGPHAPVNAGEPAAITARVRLPQRIVNAIRWRLGRVDLLRRQALATSLTPALVPGGAILEIGCASGARLMELRRQGWNLVHGIEFVPAAADRARALGFNVICGMAEEALDAIPDQTLDAAISSMVLEHLYDPFSVVRKISSKLKPGGQFLFSTIVRDSLDARLYGRYWAGFDFPRHMVHLTRDDICRMLSERFSPVRIVHQVAPIDFVRSSSWRIRRGDGRLLDKLFVALGESLPARLFNLVLAYMNRTTRVSIYCRRKSLVDA